MGHTVTAAPDVQRVGARIEHLLDELVTSADPRVSAQAEELVRLLVQLYGAGLSRIVDIVTGQPDSATSFGELLAADELVASLLVLHGLHPHDVEHRVRAAIATLGAQADGVRLVGVDADAMAHVQVLVSGCGSSAAVLRGDVERVITAAVGDVAAVRVEEVPKPKAAAPLIPVDALFRDRPAAVPR